MNLNPITMQLVADKYIRFALEEDIHSEDVSTNAVMPEYKAGEVELICKQDGVIAGLPVFERVFTMLDASTKVEWAKNQDGREVKDGDAVKKGQLLATVKGDVRVLLSGERTALNYLQRLSGIATYTHQVARLLEGSSTGGVKEAILAAKAYAPFVRKIEVETENLDMVKEAVEAGADIIMLDNMTPEQMSEAIRLIDGRAKTECSGNITKENIKTITALGVDYVSSGALTHSAPILDISLKHLKVTDSLQ